MNVLKFSILMLMSLALFGCFFIKPTFSRAAKSSLANPPYWIVGEDMKKGPSEVYELEENNGVYTMVYQLFNGENNEKKSYPITISGTPFTQETDAEGLLIKNQTYYKYGFETTFDKWTITLVDQNIEPISTLRPNGDYWKINNSGMLEIWSSGAVVETIPNAWFLFLKYSHAEFEKSAETHGGKCYYSNGSGEILQIHQVMDQYLSGMSATDYRLVLECSEGHRWDANVLLVPKNSWCPTCFDKN